MADPAKKRQVRAMLEAELKEKQNLGYVIFWTNFASAWQKMCAGTGRAKKLGKGIIESLDGLSPHEALEALHKKAFEIYGMAFIGDKLEPGDDEGTDTDHANEPRWAAPSGHAAAGEESAGSAWASPLGHAASQGARWASPLGHAAAVREQAGTAWASPMGHAAAKAEKMKGKGPPPAASDPWASFLPKGWGPPKGKGRSDAAKVAAPLIASKGGTRATAGGTKGGKPTPWARRLRAAGEGKGALVAQPQWERGSLMGDEWNVDVITQEELLERDGVALVSRQFFLEHADMLVTNGGPSAAIIPEGLAWFEDKPRSETLAKLLTDAQDVSFNYSFLENGVQRTRPKEGHLIQLAWDDVIQKTGPLRSFHAERLDEVTLEFYQDAMPPRKWQEVRKDPKQFIERVVMDVVEDRTLMLRTSRIKDKGGSMLATVKLPTDLTCTVLTNVDRHHLFARMTVRDEDKDQENEPIWMHADGEQNFLAFVRELREIGLRNAGGSYRGICMRYLRDGSGLQAGVRVVANDAPMVRRKILPETLQPADEVKHVVGKQYYRVFGLPLHMTMRSVSTQLFREIGWAVLPVREIVRPSSKTATWVVTADEAPTELRFFARFGGARAANVVSIEAEEVKARSRSFAPNKWDRPRVTGPRYFNPYQAEQDDNDMAMADESGAETVHYDDANVGEQNRDGVFESAHESSDGAWGLVARASRRKGQGKARGHGNGAPTMSSGGGAQGREAPTNGLPAPTRPPTAQNLNMEEADPVAPRQDANIMDFIWALREDARRREEEASRRHQELVEWLRRLEATSGAHTTLLTQLGFQTAALNVAQDDLNNRMLAMENTVGPYQGAAAVATPVLQRTAAADVTVPEGDADMTEAHARGRKAVREESPERADEDGRPRSKRHAQDDFESAVEAEESSQL